jgi:hypothetical protein
MPLLKFDPAVTPGCRLSTGRWQAVYTVRISMACDELSCYKPSPECHSRRILYSGIAPEQAQPQLRLQVAELA